MADWIPDKKSDFVPDNSGWIPDTPTPKPEKYNFRAEVEGMDKNSEFPRASSTTRRMILETTGATGGALAAVPLSIASGNPAPSMAGGGLGYSAGSMAADYLDELAGNKQVPTFLERMAKTGKDFDIGAMLQGGGESAANALNMAYKWAKGLGQTRIAITGEDILMRAKQILQSNTSKTPVNAGTVEAAKKLANEIPGYKPSYAESTADPDLIRLQQGLARQPGGMGAEVAHRQSNREALSNYLKNEFPGGQAVDDVIAQLNKNKAALEGSTQQASATANVELSKLTPSEPQVTGKGIFERIKKSMEPVLTEEKRLWGQVENLPIPVDNTSKAFTEAIKTPSTAEPILKKIQAIFSKSPRTVQGLRRVELEIDSAINNQSATNTERHYLRKVKDAVQSDIDALGAATDSGGIMIHNGEVVFPSKLQNEIANIDKTITSLKGKPLVIDEEAAIRGLRDKQAPSNTYLRMNQESQPGFHQRLAEDYRKFVGEEPPIKADANTAQIDALKARQRVIQDTIDNAQPAGNVAEQIKTAKNFSREQKFGRFDKGAVREILRSGNSPNNRAVPDAAVAEKFLKADNADQLIKALGDRKSAAEAMDGFIAHNMETSAINPTTGEIVPTSFNRWLSKNRAVLDKYGLTGKYDTIAKAQATLEAAKQAESAFGKTVAAKMLNADPQQAIAAAMSGGGGVSAKNTGEIMKQLVDQMKNNPDAIRGLKIAFKDFMEQTAQNTADALAGGKIMSNAKIQDIINRYDPAMKILYGEKSKEYAALRNVQKAIEVSYRSIPSPLGGGSNTVEQANTAMDILSKVVGMPGLKMGPTGSFIVRAGQKALSFLNGMTESEVTALLRRAIYDPDLAHDLLMVKRGMNPEVASKNITAKLITMGLIQAKNIGGQ